ncbi:MAG: MoaD/ThiS family protein [Anaerolineales bacterium]|jgi:molybdopterin converting factor small subunit
MVKIKIPSIWRSACGSDADVQVPAGSLLQALQAAVVQYPALEDCIFTPAGEVQPALNFFINQEHVRYLGGLQATVQDDDEIYIVPMITGGNQEMVRSTRSPDLDVHHFFDLSERSR